MYQKLGILAILASVLVSAALFATPSLKVVNAQQNQTNQTKGIDVDKWINTLKENHPLLASLAEAKDMKDAFGKIKAIQDVKEAVRTLEALHLLHELQDFKAAQEAQ